MPKKVVRLFEQFQPESYDLTLHPDRDSMTFIGSVTIRGKKVGRPSQRITFHQKELKVSCANIVKHDKKGDQPLTVSRINNQNSYDEVRLHTEDMVYPGDYTITLEFSGKITKPMNGIYPCFFTHEGKEKILIATQFESHHAREAFPCVDEPEAKATFDLTLQSPAGETVIANTPVKKQITKGKLTTTTFETTPRMSTYLLAFAYGELGFTESKTKDGVQVRAYATSENVPLTQHSVDVAVKVLEFFGDYFGTPYPLPKLDMLALPDFSSGAMENWGLITYREVAMLYDPKQSSIETKQYVALVVAHELSHQWFGNLVTMKWWDDLWLNESFANMMEYRAVDALYPEWNVWQQFVINEGASAKRRDSLVDVQAIHTTVNHPDEISTLFDPSIVYAKGGTVLHMLMHYIGEPAFQKGLQAYFSKHAYGNTIANDLWAVLSDSSGQDITTFMSGWLTRPGYPLVSVDFEPGSKQLQLQQQRFLSDSNAKVADGEPWQVPLAATVELDSPVLKESQASYALTGDSSDPLLLNHDGHSYFLPHYRQSKHVQAITAAIKANKVSDIDRLLLVDNYNLLQRGGQAATTEMLELFPAFVKEQSENVWTSLALAIAEVRRLVEGESSEDQLDHLLANLTTALAEQLGWEDAPDDSPQTLHLRSLLLSLAAGAKVKSILEEGLRRFRASKKPADLPASTRGLIYVIAARHGNQEDFTQLLKLHNATTNADEKGELAAGLTSVKDPKQIAQLIGMLKGKEIRRQDLMHWFVWLIRNRYSRKAAWEWLTTEWDWIEHEFNSDKSYSFFARYAGSVFSKPAEFTQFKEFFGPKKDIVSLARDITLAEQEIASRLAWRERNEVSVKAWLDKL